MRARVFVGSSLEALPVAEEVQKQFEQRYDVTLWNKKVFRPGENFLDALLRTANKCNFGIFVFAADDAVTRNTSERAVRDNVVFECGMFFGRLGRWRSFFLVPRDVESLHLPTDLAGVAPAHYQSNCADLADACNAIDEMMKEQLRGLDERTSLNGGWEETWLVPAAGGPWAGEHRAHAEVLHIGNQFLAVCHDKDLPFSVEGTVEWPFITGTWASNKEGSYFGAFQLQVHPTGHKMKGSMVGFDSAGEIPLGTWVWERSGI